MMQQMEKERMKFDEKLFALNRELTERSEKRDRRLMWFFGILAALFALLEKPNLHGSPRYTFEIFLEISRWILRHYDSRQIQHRMTGFNAID